MQALKQRIAELLTQAAIEAQKLRIGKVFVLTLESEFFKKLGFELKKKKSFHPRCGMNAYTAQSIFNVTRPGSSLIALNSLKS